MSIIANHGTQATSLLVTQFKNKKVLAAFIQALLAEADELERVFCQLKYLRWLDYADGQQLDGLGELLDEPRAGRLDTDYKIGLRIAILRNTCDGTPDKMILYLQAMTNATQIFYEETGVCSPNFTHNGTRVDDAITRLRSVAPAGCGIIFLSQPGDSTPEQG